MKRGNATNIANAVKLVEFIGTPGWKSRRDVERVLGVCPRQANRWICAMEEASVPLEVMGDRRAGVPSLFRRMK